MANKYPPIVSCPGYTFSEPKSKSKGSQKTSPKKTSKPSKK